MLPLHGVPFIPGIVDYQRDTSGRGSGLLLDPSTPRITRRQCVNVDEKYQSRYIREKEVGTFRFVRTADPEREGKVILEFNDCLNRYIIFREDRFRELSSRVNIYAPSIFKKKKTIFKLISKFLIRIAIRPSISFPSQRRRRKKERNKQKYVIGRFFRSDSTNEREYSQKLVITSRCMMTHRYPKR